MSIPEIRLATESDSEKLLKLIKMIHPTLDWDTEKFNWQFFKTPGGPSSVYYLENEASTDNQVIAIYCSINQRVRSENNVIKGRMIQDVMTHPDHRGKGYLHLLAKRCMADLVESNEVGYTFPNEKSENSFRRTGWTELCQVPLREVSDLKTNIEKSSINSELDQSNFSRVAEKIWESQSHLTGVHRDRHFFDWRYSKPRQEYHRYSLNAGEAYLVLKFFKDGETRVAHICDFLPAKGCEGIANDALEFAKTFARENEATKLTSWLTTGHPIESFFENAGFSNSKISRHVFVYPPKNSKAVTNPSLWQLTQGDSDVY